MTTPTIESQAQAESKSVPMRLWDAGFAGEQSAEHGPVMRTIQELVEFAYRKGAMDMREWAADKAAAMVDQTIRAQVRNRFMQLGEET